MNQKITIDQIQKSTFEDVMRLLQKGDISEPVVLRLNLDTARTLEQIQAVGNYIVVVNASSAAANVQVVYNRPDTTPMTFVNGTAIVRPYYQIYITHDAQASEWVDLLISAFYPSLMEVKPNISVGGSITTPLGQLHTDNVTTQGKIDTIDTDLKSYLRSINGDTVTQILKSNSPIYNTIAIIHTVTAGKNLYLKGFNFSSWQQNNDAAIVGNLFITDPSDTVWHILAQAIEFSNTVGSPSQCIVSRDFSKPILIPEGYKIKLNSNSTSLAVSGSIDGWEE